MARTEQISEHRYSITVPAGQTKGLARKCLNSILTFESTHVTAISTRGPSGSISEVPNVPADHTGTLVVRPTSPAPITSEMIEVTDERDGQEPPPVERTLSSIPTTGRPTASEDHTLRPGRIRNLSSTISAERDGVTHLRQRDDEWQD